MLLRYVPGILFQAPRGSILIHACNTVGSWGAGIAKAFKSRYPEAFEVYRDHCKEHHPNDLIGTCLIIRSEAGDHDIACLFTSRDYGKRVDSQEDILAATRLAIQGLLKQNQDPKKPLHAWYELPNIIPDNPDLTGTKKVDLIQANLMSHGNLPNQSWWNKGLR